MRSVNRWSAKALILIGCTLLGVGPLAAQEDHVQQLLGKMAARVAAMPLQGLKNCGVLVENLDQEAVRGGLNERNLQHEVRARLTALGLRVRAADVSSNPYIHIFVVSLELNEQVIPVRDKAILFQGITWQRMAQSAAGQNDLSSKVIQALSELLDEFRKDYSSVNSQ